MYCLNYIPYIGRIKPRRYLNTLFPHLATKYPRYLTLCLRAHSKPARSSQLVWKTDLNPRPRQREFGICPLDAQHIPKASACQSTARLHPVLSNCRSQTRGRAQTTDCRFLRDREPSEMSFGSVLGPRAGAVGGHPR